MPELRNGTMAPEQSIGELFGQLSSDVATLLRQEAQLARVEMREKLSRIAGDVTSLATGAIVVLLGGMALTAAVILVLAGPVGLDGWVAALLVGAAMALIGWVMLRKSLTDLKRRDPLPRRAVESIKEDIQSVKEQRS